MTTILDPQNAGATGEGGAANLDKVRDLIFGGQMRDYERRFAALEERILKETAELREELRRRLSSVEALLAREVDALNDRLRAEQEDRSNATKEVGRQLEETARNFERKTHSLDDQMARGMRDLRQQLHDQHQQLTDDLKRQADQILERLGRDAQQLQHDKTDRASLAALLTEMAMRLTDDFRLPTTESATRD